MSRRGELLRLLADGREHSGEHLAGALQITRAAVWKQLQQLEDWGLEIVATPGRGYQLPQPLELLDPATVRSAMPEQARDRLRNLGIDEELDSTNERLLAVNDLPPGRFDACLAEFQRAGRGRRGRIWTSPYASGLCLSVNWTFADAPPQLGALSLAVGVALLRLLRGLGARELALKWPNDLLHGGQKLGGILIELRAETGGPAYAVVGVGLNLTLPDHARVALRSAGADATDLQAALGRRPGRNALAGQLAGQLALALEEFGRQGLQPFAQEWRAADALCGRPVQVQHGEQRLEGVSQGIDEQGALLVEIGGQRRRFVSGEVTLRAGG